MIVPTMLTSTAGVDPLLEHVEVLALGNLRSVHPLRDPQRFRRHQHVRRTAPTTRFWRARERASRRSTSSSAGATPIASSSFIAIGNGTPASTRGSAGSGSAERSKSSTACCGAPPTPASRPRSAQLDVLPSVRYCLTLDSDTRLPRDAAKRLIGIIAHPLNQAQVDRQPRARHRRLRDSAAARQRDHGERGRIAVRAHVRRPHRRRPVHDGGLRRVPGSLRAKASSPARACTTSTRSRRRSTIACPRTPCSRTISSKASTRARRSSPTSRSSTTTRPASSPTRGGSTAGCAATGRFCGGCFRSCPRARGVARNRLPLIARWKILDNLRRSLLPPATLLLLVLGLDDPAGRTLDVDRRGLAALASRPWRPGSCAARVATSCAASARQPTI